MLNSVNIMGRIGSDIEVRRTENGIISVSFAVAVQRNYKNQKTNEKETDWVYVQAWRNNAEYIKRYFQKGDLVVVNGEIRSDKWVDKDGKNRSKLYILCNGIYRASSAKSKIYDTKGDTVSEYTTYNQEEKESSIFELSSEDGDLPF